MRTSPLSLLALAFLVSVQAKAADPTARDLIALAPIVSSKDESIRSIEIAGYYALDDKIDTTFRALYQSPGRFAFLMSDGASGIPISFSVNRNIAESGRGHPLSRTRETWLAPNVHLATDLPPHAPRSTLDLAGPFLCFARGPDE